MITTDTNKLVETVEELQAAATAGVEKESPVELTLVERQINLLEAAIREEQQAMWSAEAKAAIRRLEKGDPLNETDLAVIREFLVSDAERYVALENNYHDWVRELGRLLDEVARRVPCIDRESVGDLRGVLKDAVRLVPDIRNYLEEKRRIEQFHTALATLDDGSRQTMANILREQLSSPKQ